MRTSLFAWITITTYPGVWMISDSAVTPDAMRRFQTDPTSELTEFFLPPMFDAVARASVTGEVDTAAVRGAALLREWDGRFTPENERAVLYDVMMEELARRTWAMRARFRRAMTSLDDAVRLAVAAGANAANGDLAHVIVIIRERVRQEDLRFGWLEWARMCALEMWAIGARFHMSAREPIIESEYAPSTFTTGLYVGIVGDWSTYWIADSLDIEILRLDERYSDTLQVGFQLMASTDGMPTLAEAWARVKLA